MAKRYQGVLPFWQGVTITSTDGGRHNKGSKHYTGDAIDIDHITGKKKYGSFENAAALFSKQYPDWRLVNEEVKNNPAWTGPHWHAEYIGGGQPKQNTFTALSGNQKPMMQNPFTPPEYKPQAFNPLQVNVAAGQAPTPPALVADAEQARMAALSGDYTMRNQLAQYQKDVEANNATRQQIQEMLKQAQAQNTNPSVGRTLLGALLGGGVGALGSALSGENIGTGLLLGAGGGAAGAFSGQQTRQLAAQKMLPSLLTADSGMATANADAYKAYMDGLNTNQLYRKGETPTRLFNFNQLAAGKPENVLPMDMVLTEDQVKAQEIAKLDPQAQALMFGNMSKMGTQLLNQGRGAPTSPVELVPLPNGTSPEVAKTYLEKMFGLLSQDTSSPTSVGAGIREADMKTPIEVAKVNTDILRANNDAQNNQQQNAIQQMRLQLAKTEAAKINSPVELAIKVDALRRANKNDEAKALIDAYKEIRPKSYDELMFDKTNTGNQGTNNKVDIVGELTKGLQ